jgi:hypothetical protein
MAFLMAIIPPSLGGRTKAKDLNSKVSMDTMVVNSVVAVTKYHYHEPRGFTSWCHLAAVPAEPLHASLL